MIEAREMVLFEQPKMIEIPLNDYTRLVQNDMILERITAYVTHCGDYVHKDIVCGILGIKEK